ncbi:MAG: hypothetical protein L3J46_09350 [Kangiellaceae bacterium]|nr:hypothetical protein [Kangiellaceae bacterium]
MRDEDDKLTFFYCGDPELEAFKIIKTNLAEQEHDLIDYYNEFKIDIYLLLDKRKSKFIAIDWDNTISADQQYFLQLIRKFQNAGYTPFVCSLRAPDIESIEEIKKVLEETNIAIYLTDGKPKRRFMKKLGVKVHLWIDDFYPGISHYSCKFFARNNIE